MSGLQMASSLVQIRIHLHIDCCRFLCEGTSVVERPVDRVGLSCQREEPGMQVALPCG
jgi:hypothetical protein